MAILKKMPNSTSASEILDKMYLLYKVEQGRAAIKKGDFFTESEVKKRLSKWSK